MIQDDDQQVSLKVYPIQVWLTIWIYDFVFLNKFPLIFYEGVCL